MLSEPQSLVLRRLSDGWTLLVPAVYARRYFRPWIAVPPPEQKHLDCPKVYWRTFEALLKRGYIRFTRRNPKMHTPDTDDYGITEDGKLALKAAGVF